ncbi:PP2C5 [Symbiodinium natans]|uniref:PP2C5 protein n=1 Tax=Symbiodinium natans TaxID=878477 RepID=A0A812MVU0_9DINO|nr:PP2C5 [Symbiodinium natans]
MPGRRKDELPKAPLASAGEVVQASACGLSACWATAGNVSKVHDNEDRAFTDRGRLWLEDGTEVSYQTAAVVDGHGGAGACELIAETAMRILGEHLEAALGDVCAALSETFADLEEQCLALTPPSGACMCLCIAEKGRAWVANLGDCRALAVSLEDGGCLLSLDHRSGEGTEYTRILEAGGSVVGNAVEGLMPSRTLGDADVKTLCPPRVILAEAEVRTWDGQGLVIIASDGLWDVLSSADVLDLLPKGKSLRRVCQDPGTLQALADGIVDKAMRLGAQDDVTTLLLPVL